MTLPKAYLRKGVVTLVIGLPVVIVIILALRPSGHNAQVTSAILTILGQTNENGRQVVAFELRVPPGRRIGIRTANLVTDWGTSTAIHGPPEWTRGTDPSRKVFEPGTKTILSIIEPSQRLRRLRLETMEFEVGPRTWPRKLKLFWQTKKLSVLKMNLPPVHSTATYVQSGLISSYASEPGGAANRGQSVGSEINRPSAAAGSSR
jgi:hypothetical protein